MMYNNEHLASPPPAHMGIPPVHIDPKTGKSSTLIYVLFIQVLLCLQFFLGHTLSKQKSALFERLPQYW